MTDSKDISNTSNNVQNKSDIALHEEAILEFWNKNNIFKKSEEKDAPKGEFVFYDGPPFASGPPHYGHFLASTIKDAIPRYKTMRGYRVNRRWGWDCHGLPVENLIEKELDLKTKKDIELYGIEKFNEAARSSIMRDADIWKKIIPRLGRFVDMERDYKTMDTSYTESVWWIFNELNKKKFIYKGFKSMHLCPRCGTTLSNFEVNQGYKDITDISVYVKLELEDEPGTYLLVWTTTPWTLPGNMAAAIHKDVTYIKVKTDAGNLILAKNRLSVLDGEYSVIEEFKGEKLLGKSYTPLFSYFQDSEIKGRENAWKIYHADYVSTEDGTGAVHIAPAFGEEDLQLAQKEGIPIVHHISPDGEFIKEVKDFAGLQAKPKDDPQRTDIEIIKHLAHDERNLLYKKEKVTHSYPHCWRCDTPLLNYASSSWFVKVKRFKDKLVSENKKIKWVPKEMGENRFGNWLEGARDWAISRSRYWGAPLPVWEDKKKSTYITFGSIADLKKSIKRSGNKYLIMRHGEAVFNTKNTLNSNVSVDNPLTEKGKENIKIAVKGLSGKIDVVIHSPLQRTRETAKLLVKELGLSEEILKEDARLKEVTFGEFEGKSVDKYHSFYKFTKEQMLKKPHGGESWSEVKNRITEALYKFENEYKDKTILIVSHNGPLQMIQAGSEGFDMDTCGECITDDRFDLKTGEVRELSFIPLPHNKNFELDLHRPYIDDVEVVNKEGEVLKRVPEVFDCWFESGSMPYAQQHYPFKNTDTFEPKSGLFSKSKGYPADFIAEGTDQTRGWFYSLIVLGVGLFNKAPYKNVIVNGMILAEDGQKMSKRLRNYPDPVGVMDKYGADALRYYLLSSPIVRGEDLSFSESGVDEVMKKLVGRLSNVSSFYELYKGDVEDKTKSNSTHMLDRWILERTKELTKAVTDAMEKYELDKATRPIGKFIDDLSTWYIRRSRDRFKGDDTEDKLYALNTTREVLFEMSKIIAPFMPFYAETLYQTVKSESDPESVHLCEWPEVMSVDNNILNEMEEVRNIVSLALEARSSDGIKVRQPLAQLKVKSKKLKGKDGLLELIQDEVNVKEVVVDSSIEPDVLLDIKLTPELKSEGVARDIVRQIQQFRKDSNLSPQDTITLVVDVDSDLKKIIEDNMEDIKQTALIREILFESVDGEGASISGKRIAFKLK